MGGAFQTSRDIFQHDIWQDVVKFRIFFFIVGNAVFSHEGVDIAGIHVERGQFLRSLRNLRDDLTYQEGRGNAVKKYPLTTIQRKIKSLVNEGQIKVKSTENGTLFTVVNYAKYQGFEHYQKKEVEQLRNSDGTEMEQRWNNNKKVEEGSKKDKKDNKKRLVFDDKQKQLAELLWKYVEMNAPSMKQPNLNSWANTIRLMMEMDKREGKDIQETIIWATKHYFWHKNILSADKLRKQFDQLKLQMAEDEKKVTQISKFKGAPNYDEPTRDNSEGNKTPPYVRLYK
jgi:hypothetical protein